MSRFLCIALCSTVTACHGGKAAAPVGNTTVTSESNGPSAPASSELVAMVRGSTLPPGPECSGMAQEHTLGAIWAAYSQLERNEAKDVNLPFVEEGSCRPEPSGRSVWTCEVYASPDWTKADEEPVEGGDNFLVTFELDASNQIIPSTLYCVAAG